MSDKESPGMTPEQRLYPGELYALNRILEKHCQEIERLVSGDNHTATLIPVLFSKHSRTFHWMAVNPSKWAPDAKFLSEPFKKLSEKCVDGNPDPKKRSPTPAWGVFKGNLPIGVPLFGNAALDVEHHLLDGHEVQEANAKILHRHLLALYEGYHHHPHLNADGIVLRTLKKIHRNNEQHRHIAIEYLHFSFAEKIKNDCLPWLDIKFIISPNENISLHRYHSQEEEISKATEEEITSNHMHPRADEGKDISEVLRKHFFPPSTKHHEGLLMPIYDGAVNNKLAGSLWGGLALFGPGLRDGNDEKINDIAARLRTVSGEVAAELARAAHDLVLNQPIEPPYDLVEHFVSNLRFLQDWERIIVFEHEGQKCVPRYCYAWRKKGASADAPEWQQREWRRCEPAECAEGGHPCVDWASCQEQGGNYLCWEQNFWQEAYIPGISQEKAGRFENIRLAFEFPISAVIPKDEPQRHMLEELYVRQQLELLSALLVKVRARRHALRAAAVAIMSRNMSHNIGSHVLVRAASDRPADPPADGNNSEIVKRYVMQMSQLQRYMQERMDFIAELATAESYMELPVMLCGEVGGGFAGQVLIQKYISGVHYLCNGSGYKPVTATVTIENCADGRSEFCFASPGGRMGVQALYVIVENIIRNTAKHSSPTDWNDHNVGGQVDLDITVNDCNEDLWKVVVSEKLSKWCKKVEGSEFSEDSDQKNEMTLFKYLNKAIKGEMIDQSGALNPKHWGIREMMVCAAYLRGIAPEDIEERIYPPLFKAVKVTNYLGFQFFLKKPQEVMVVRKENNAGRRQDAPTPGVTLRQELSSGKVRHRYLVIADGQSLPGISEYARLPVAIFVNEGNPCSNAGKKRVPSVAVSSLDTCGANQLLNGLSEAWYCRTLKRYDVEDPKLYRTPDSEGPNSINIFEDNNHDKFPMVFDHHGNLSMEVINKLKFWEPYGNPDPQCQLFENPPKGLEEWLSRQFKISAMAKIVVLDERVQGAAEEYLGVGNSEKRKNMKIRDVLEKARVYVPARGACNLDMPETKKIKHYFHQFNEDQFLDFIVIHQGILDRLRAKKENAKEDALGLIEDLASKYGAVLVICSGRGVPTGLSHGTRFVPFSSVMRWTIPKRSKFHLYQLLFFSRSAV